MGEQKRRTQLAQRQSGKNQQSPKSQVKEQGKTNISAQASFAALLRKSAG
jgi:hypothetical protein